MKRLPQSPGRQSSAEPRWLPPRRPRQRQEWAPSFSECCFSGWSFRNPKLSRFRPRCLNVSRVLVFIPTRVSVATSVGRAEGKYFKKNCEGEWFKSFNSLKKRNSGAFGNVTVFFLPSLKQRAANVTTEQKSFELSTCCEMFAVEGLWFS